ncbi:MAG: LysM peptidoglycan-binding domain-containing protein [bacterium]
MTNFKKFSQTAVTLSIFVYFFLPGCSSIIIPKQPKDSPGKLEFHSKNNKILNSKNKSIQDSNNSASNNLSLNLRDNDYIDDRLQQQGLEEKNNLSDNQEFFGGDRANEDQEIVNNEEAGGKEDVGVILDQALEIYQEVEVVWAKNDFEKVLMLIDNAYELLLQVNIDEESPELTQQKDDLRLLLARRLVEIYASQKTAVGDNGKSIPLVMNSYVEQEIKVFQSIERQFFIDSYQRSGRYMGMIIREFKAAGLPEELSWLPLIESGFKSRAFSRAGALGIWQFISSTGYKFGLKRTEFVDERMNVLLATKAAINYLHDLHELFGDWTTALAGYNCGEGNVLRAIKSQKIRYLDNFWDLYKRLPRETARYVPRFIATLHIIKDPQKYGFDFGQPYPPYEYEEVLVNKPLKLSVLSESAGLGSSILGDINPSLRYGSTPDHDFWLKVPKGQGEKIVAKVSSLPKWLPSQENQYNDKYRYVTHYVKKGETLFSIARRYFTTPANIAKLNRLSTANRIFPGQRLKVPMSSSRVASKSKVRTYHVRKGDCLSIIAQKCGVSIKRIKQLNKIKNNNVKIGQNLVIGD